MPSSLSTVSNDDLLCFCTLEITDRDFGLWRQKMAVSDIHTLTTFHALVPSKTLADQVQRADFSLLVTSGPRTATVRFKTPSHPTSAPTMMIRHWAPTILDGYAYHGRPQKPRRLISARFLVFWRIRTKILADIRRPATLPRSRTNTFLAQASLFYGMPAHFPCPICNDESTQQKTSICPSFGDDDNCHD
ncbi:hypothetical protein HBI33_229630 [Parastagonospora nodorum]|nr:hypothetical protein HBI33_229630 [Parastagonospora nodorum]